MDEVSLLALMKENRLQIFKDLFTIQPTEIINIENFKTVKTSGFNENFEPVISDRDFTEIRFAIQGKHSSSVIQNGFIVDGKTVSYKGNTTQSKGFAILGLGHDTNRLMELVSQMFPESATGEHPFAVFLHQLSDEYGMTYPYLNMFENKWYIQASRPYKKEPDYDTYFNKMLKKQKSQWRIRTENVDLALEDIKRRRANIELI